MKCGRFICMLLMLILGVSFSKYYYDILSPCAQWCIGFATATVVNAIYGVFTNKGGK